ncbi:MAG: response regulator transcription factor [Chloroflexi bacterium]|nr:response regulator transcription factor [Chloroflexota bacterium]
MVVDDHELVRIGLRAVAESEKDIAVIGEYSNAESALENVERLHLDVVMMGIRMVGMDGIHACRHIRNRLPEVKVVILTSQIDEDTIVASIVAGASGYLLKNTDVRALLLAVRIVAKGESLLHPAVTQRVLDRLKDMVNDQDASGQDEQPDGVSELLSERENEVFALIVEGCTNKEIASRLLITENTARNHVSHILQKLGVRRRGQVALFRP